MYPKESRKTVEVEAGELKIGIVQEKYLQGLSGPTSKDHALEVLKVELMENIPGLDFKRVLARRVDGVVFSALAGEQGITNGDLVVFRWMENKGNRSMDPFDQHIYVAKKVK